MSSVRPNQARRSDGFTTLNTFLTNLLHIGGDLSLRLPSGEFQRIYNTLMQMDGSRQEKIVSMIGNYRLMLRLNKYPGNPDDRFHVTIFVNGMKYYDGSFDPNFLQNSECTYYKEGIRIHSGMFFHGKKHGYFRHYDEQTDQEISTEVYENNVKITDIYIVDGKCYREQIMGYTRQIGEVIIDGSNTRWCGRTIEYQNGKPSYIYDYSREKKVIGQFTHLNGFDGFLEYDNSNNISYFGNIKLDERTLNYSYEGLGMKFEMNGGMPCIVYKGGFKNGSYSGHGCTYSPEFGLKLFEGDFENGEPLNGVSFINGIIQRYVVHTLEDMQKFSRNCELFEVAEKGLNEEIQVDFHSFVAGVKKMLFGEGACEKLKSFFISEFHSLKEIRFAKDCLRVAEEIVLNNNPALETISIGIGVGPAVKKLEISGCPKLHEFSLARNSLITCSRLVLYDIEDIPAVTLDPASLTKLCSLCVSERVSASLIDRITKTSVGEITRQSTNYTVSDIMMADSEICHDLVIKDHTKLVRGVSFNTFPSLVSLVIGDHCHSDGLTFMLKQPMSQLRSINIGHYCFSDPLEQGSFVVENQPSLRSITIGNGSFTNFIMFHVKDCPELTAVSIGLIPAEERDWFIKEENTSNCFQNSSGFELENVPKLEKLEVGVGCFEAKLNVSLKGLTRLQQVSVADFSFSNCLKLELSDLYGLEVLQLLPFAFYHTQEIEVKNCNEKLHVTPTFCTDHFKVPNLRVEAQSWEGKVRLVGVPLLAEQIKNWNCRLCFVCLRFFHIKSFE